MSMQVMQAEQRMKSYAIPPSPEIENRTEIQMIEAQSLT